MNKIFTLAAIAALATGSAAFAADSSDIAADKGAIAKDNAAISNQNSNIEQNRAEKAAAKASDSPASQASESVQIGANKTAKAWKKGEKKVDQKILNHDQDPANQTR